MKEALRKASDAVTGAYADVLGLTYRNSGPLMSMAFIWAATYGIMTSPDTMSVVLYVMCILLHAVLLLMHRDRIRKEREERRKISSSKRITVKDADGNYTIKESDLHKAIAMLGQYEDMNRR